MRIGKVIGKICLNPARPELLGGRFLIVEVQDRFSLTGQARRSKEALVVYDELSAGEGDLIGFTESREATMPFYPERMVPIDAYNSAILDRVTIEMQDFSHR